MRQRLMAIMCRAELAARSPPRLSRCRVVIPDEAGSGAAPQSIAKEASEARRSGLSPAVMSSWAADSSTFRRQHSIIYVISNTVLAPPINQEGDDRHQAVAGVVGPN